MYDRVRVYVRVIVCVLALAVYMKADRNTLKTKWDFLCILF